MELCSPLDRDQSRSLPTDTAKPIKLRLWVSRSVSCVATWCFRLVGVALVARSCLSWFPPASWSHPASWSLPAWLHLTWCSLPSVSSIHPFKRHRPISASPRFSLAWSGAAQNSA